jgi:drug/metabolite transporter (DMT)-like permease
MATSRTMSGSDWALLFLLSVIWGGSFLFNKLAVNELPPLTVAFSRVFGGAIWLYLIAKIMRQSMPRTRAAWLALAGMGLLNNVIPFSLILWSQQYISSGLTAILNATTPLFTVLIAHFFTTDERFTPGRIAGVLIGFSGVVLMIGPDLIGDLGNNVVAQIVMLLVGIFYAVSGIYGRRFHNIPPVITATGQMTSASIMLLPLVLIVDRPWTLPMPSNTALAALFLLGALCTTAAYLIFFRILRRAGATNLMLVTLLIPVSAILLGSLVLGEQLAWRHFAGMAIIAIGLAAIDGRPWQWLTRRKQAAAA